MHILNHVYIFFDKKTKWWYGILNCISNTNSVCDSNVSFYNIFSIHVFFHIVTECCCWSMVAHVFSPCPLVHMHYAMNNWKVFFSQVAPKNLDEFNTKQTEYDTVDFKTIRNSLIENSYIVSPSKNVDDFSSISIYFKNSWFEAFPDLYYPQ